MGLDRLRVQALIILGFTANATAQAHEPIFGLGPRVDFRGAIGIEAEVEIEREGPRNGESSLNYEVLYALTNSFLTTVRAFPTLWTKKRKAALRLALETLSGAENTAFTATTSSVVSIRQQ